jgi:hypothetical protein
MDLRTLVERMATLPEDGTIFAKQARGAFTPSSEAVVLRLSQAELQSPVSEVAARRAPGFHYFLEVSVASEVLEAYRAEAYMQAAEPDITAALVFYAIHDAFPT